MVVSELFQWQPREKDGPMELEDDCITCMQKQKDEERISSDEDSDDGNMCTMYRSREWKLQQARKSMTLNMERIRVGRIRTMNPIPRSLGGFSFTIHSSSPNPTFAAGFTSNSKSVIYEGGVGLISNEELNYDWDFNGEDGMIFWNGYRKEKITETDKTEINDKIECNLIYQSIGKRKYALVNFIKNGVLLSKQALETEVVWPVITIGSSQTKIELAPNSEEHFTIDKSGMVFNK